MDENKKQEAVVVGIIPARMASSRFPGKPLANICGIPMIGHVYLRSKMCKCLKNVYVATCDRDIADYIMSIGGEVVMTADTHERASDRTAEAMLKLEAQTQGEMDTVVMIQGDEPMVFPEMIEESLNVMLWDNTIEITNLMAPLKSIEEYENPNVVKVVTDKKNSALYFSREPIPYCKTTSEKPPMYKQVPIISFRRDFLIKFNELTPTPFEIAESIDMLRLLEHGYKIRMVRSSYNIYGVDTPQDLKKVEGMLKQDSLINKYRN